MVRPSATNGNHTAKLIRTSGISIYDPIEPNSPLLFDIKALEDVLRTHLIGRSMDYPLRTRSKCSKTFVTQAMGYPVPKSFTKTKPRFPGQNLDVYVQKADNLQIWNEQIDPLRRYAIIRVNDASVITAVRVVTGATIALLDRTGKLTQKFQASRRPDFTGSKLVSLVDTNNLIEVLQPAASPPSALGSPTDRPDVGQVLPIAGIYSRLSSLVGTRLAYGDMDQERHRGAALQRIVCQALGYKSYADTGQFPDILNQVLEVKLQTSRTIDLGLVSPDSQSAAQEVGKDIRHCDVRYAIFFASRIGVSDLVLNEVVVSTGEAFFREFQRFEGKVTNTKIQIPLPSDFFA